MREISQHLLFLLLSKQPCSSHVSKLMHKEIHKRCLIKLANHGTDLIVTPRAMAIYYWNIFLSRYLFGCLGTLYTQATVNRLNEPTPLNARVHNYLFMCKINFQGKAVLGYVLSGSRKSYRSLFGCAEKQNGG